MDELEKKSDWLECASIVLGIVFVVIAVVLLLLLLGPQYANVFQTGPDNLWLHAVGL